MDENPFSDDVEYVICGNFKLTRHSMQDVGCIVRNHNDTRITKYTRGPLGPTYGIEEATNFLKIAINATVEDTHGNQVNIFYAIRDGKNCIGSLFVKRKDTRDAKEDILNPNIDGLYGELGYWLDTEYQGKGIVTKAVSTAVEQIGIGALGLQTFVGLTFAGNYASKRVLEKNGFELVREIKEGAEKAYPREKKDVWQFIKTVKVPNDHDDSFSNRDTK